MSHGKLREEKNCLNCGYTVEQRFCPHCGQENIETRQPFHYLFTHFVEDFTHYDGQFWKTMKYLLFHPGKLSKEYLLGKRQQYVAPVKLYIFISFVTFLLPGFLPHHNNESNAETKTVQARKAKQQTENAKAVLETLQQENIISGRTAADTKKIINPVKADDENDNLIEDSFKSEDTPIMKAYSLEQYDDLLKKDKTGSYKTMRPIAKKMFELQEKGLTKKQIIEKYIDTIIHTLPKALFIYLPIFAFFLWIFHNKKKWWYFDHGIFTLHYFSFLLLAILTFIVLKNIVTFLPDNTILNGLSFLIFAAIIVYLSVYFFIAHHRVYENSRTMSIFKGALLFIVNSFGLIVMFLVLLYVSLITLH